MSAGKVKIAPAEIDVPAEAPVATILFSRIFGRPKSGRTAIEMTAAGMAVATVIPANKPTYALAEARMTVRMTERRMALSVSCGAGAAPAFIPRHPLIFLQDG